jgi:hypothetical protein
MVALVIACRVTATTLPAIPLEELFRDADIVVIAEVVQGEIVRVGGQPCAAKYIAKVEESFKGAPKDATIEFGNFVGYELGSRYLLFIVGPERRHEPMMSTNSMHLQAKAALTARCGPTLQRSTVMHSGNGALRIDWTAKFNYKDGVRVPTRWVVLPKNIESVPATPSEKEEFAKVAWVRVEDMIRALRGLAK